MGNIIAFRPGLIEYDSNVTSARISTGQDEKTTTTTTTTMLNITVAAAATGLSIKLHIFGGGTDPRTVCWRTTPRSAPLRMTNWHALPTNSAKFIFGMGCVCLCVHCNRLPALA